MIWITLVRKLSLNFYCCSSANNVNNKEVTEESSNSLDRCTICKCPLPK